MFDFVVVMQLPSTTVREIWSLQNQVVSASMKPHREEQIHLHVYMYPYLCTMRSPLLSNLRSATCSLTKSPRSVRVLGLPIYIHL